MKALIITLSLTGLICACRGRAKTYCHSQVLNELLIPVYQPGLPGYMNEYRFSLQCAGKCPDGTPCDTIVELSTDDDGIQYRKVRCGCKGQPASGCNIYIYHPVPYIDTSTILFCPDKNPCPINSDRCITQERRLTPDTVRSRLTGRDSIIIEKWVTTCECM